LLSALCNLPGDIHHAIAATTYAYSSFLIAANQLQWAVNASFTKAVFLKLRKETREIYIANNYLFITSS
jgi:hypothetical protein